MPNTPVTYRDWNAGYGEPTRRPAYDEDEARRRFAAGETLYVLFGDEDQPDVVLCVDLGGRQIEVLWLDELTRPELMYLFGQPDGSPDDQLFLEQTRLSAYDHDLRVPEGETIFDESWYFRPDGSLYAARGTRGGPSERAYGHLEADQLPVHWEPRPAFGQWDGLIQRER